MKFIHTADWHLGKLLKEHAMTEDQEWLLMHRFLPLVDEERPDVILLSGDVYDRSYPPEEAVELFDRMTEEIVGKRHTPLIVISGNHDSAERLAVASRLLSHQGLYIFGPLDRVHPVILEDAWGKVAFVPLPYAEPARVRVMMNQKGLSGAEDIHSYEEAEKKLSDILLSALPDPSMRKVALAHVFAAGGRSRSEAMTGSRMVSLMPTTMRRSGICTGTRGRRSSRKGCNTAAASCGIPSMRRSSIRASSWERSERMAASRRISVSSRRSIRSVCWKGHSPSS
mgnify:CR=1 FL=1